MNTYAKLKDWGFLGLLCLIAVLGILGQFLPSILLQPIKSELELSDATIGFVTGVAVTVVGAIFAFPIGMLADKIGRIIVLAGSILVWSMFIVVLGLSRDVGGYTAGLLGFHIGDAALLPLIYAIVATRFDANRRETANAILVSIILLSGSGVFAFGGYLLSLFESLAISNYSPWRLVCLSVACLGPVLGFILLINRGEKPLTAGEASKQYDQSFLSFLKQDGLLIGALMLSISVFHTAASVFVFWLPSLIERLFQIPPAEANIAIGQYMLVATLLAIVFTIGLSSRARKHWGHVAPLKLMILGCAIGILPSIGLFFVSSVQQTLLFVSVLTFSGSVTMLLVPSLLQSCAPDRFRSRTIALFPVFSVLMRTLLPAMIGYLSTFFGEEGETLLQILSWMLVISFTFSILALALLAPRFGAFAARNLAEDET